MKVWKWKKLLLSVTQFHIKFELKTWCLEGWNNRVLLRRKQDSFTAFDSILPTRNLFFKFYCNIFFQEQKQAFSVSFNRFTARISTYHTISFETVSSKCLCRILCQCVWLWGKFSLILVPPGMCCRISLANTVVQATSVHCLGCIQCVLPILWHKLTS